MRIEPIYLRTLGIAQADVGQVQVRPNAVRRFAAVLYLSAEAGRRIPRRCLIELLYPDQTERNGLHSLRELLYQLKSAGVGLETDQEGIELPVGAVRADYVELLASERLSLEQIHAAQGGFLPGYTPHQSEAYKEWFEPFRSKVVFGLSQALLREQARARDVGNLELSAVAARACLAVSPLNEHAVKGLAETLALGGAKLQAVRLLDEYGAEVGCRSPELKISSDMLKRRIQERVQNYSRSSAELPFVGRESEMLELRRRLAASRPGTTQRLVVVGEPGIGKTRLVNEFAALVGLESRVVRVTIQPYDERRPMGVLIDLVPSLLQLPGALGIAPESMEALTRLTKRHSTQTGNDYAFDEPETVSRAITHALDDLLWAITTEAHLTMILEDAQWADQLSLQVLGELSMKERRLFILSTSRDRELPEFGARFTEAAGFVTLPPLDQAFSAELARRALHGTVGGRHDQLHAWMAEIANGNPLFISLLVHHFLATGTAFAVPRTVHELIAKNLDALDAATTTILQSCVLLRSLATLTRIVKVLDLPYIEAVTGVSRLHTLRMVKFTEEKLQPSHALLAEALLQRSPQAVHRMLHLKIAAVLEEELRSAESSALLWHCAEHWVAAGEHDRALNFLLRCAEHTNSIGRPGAAAETLLRAATLQIDATTRVTLLRQAIRWARGASELGLILNAVEQLRQLDPAVRHDDVELAELHAISVTHRDSEEYETRLMSCLESAESDPEHRVRAAVAALQYSDGYSKPALASHVRHVISDADLSRVDEVLALEYRLVYNAVYGDPLVGARVARTLLDLASTLPAARAAALHFNAVIALWRAGAAAEALTICERSHTLASSCGSIRIQFAASLQMAAMLIDHGRFDEARPWRDRTSAIQAANEYLLDGIELRALEIDFCLVEGSITEAEAGLRRTDELGLFSSPSRQRWRRCLAARLRQLAGGPELNDEEIEDLLQSGSGSHPSTGIRDIEMAVIVAGLTAKGERGRAQNVLETFLEERARHFRGPLARQLYNAIVASGMRPPACTAIG